MNKISTIIFGILVVLLPMVPFSRPGIFSGHQAAYVAVIVCCVLLFFVLRVRQGGMRGMQVRISLSDALVALYLVYGLINIAFLQGFRVDPFLYWKWGAVGFVYVVARNIARDVTRQRMVLVALIVAGVAQSLVAIAQKLSLLPSNHSAFKVTGTFGNPGQLAGLLCVALVVALCLLLVVRKQKGKALWLYGLSTLLIVVGLLLADSRAALVGVVVGLVIWSWPALSAFFRKHKVTMSVALIALIVVAGIMLFRYKPGSANARLLVWRVGIEMVLEKPVAGYGVASFHQVYMPRQAEYFEAHSDSPWRLVADNAVYPYNEPLHLLMEQGIIGLLIMIAIFVSVFTSVTLRRRSRPQNSAKTGRQNAKPIANPDRQIFKGALAALTVYSCFSYPSYVFALLFLLPVLLGSLESRPIKEFKLPGWISALGKILLIVCIIQAMRLIGYYRESEKMVGHLFSGDPHAQQYITENYGRLRYNPVFNNIYAVWIGDHPDVAYNLPPEQIAGMDPFCEGYCTIGNYYAIKGMYAEAEHYYLTAANMIPTRLMPNYLLWHLYAAQGDTVRASATARKALEQPLKIENDFTRAAKDEMRDYLTQ